MKNHNEYMKKNIKLLVNKYPNCFSEENPKPLKVGIFEDLVQDLMLDNKMQFSLEKVISFYINNSNYHKAVIRSDFGYDLQGNQCGKIPEEQKKHAKMKLKEISNKMKNEIKKEETKHECSTK